MWHGYERVCEPVAQSIGLHARRLLLLNENRITKHVVVEVLIEDRWFIIDPFYHGVLRLPNGRLVTGTELQSKFVLSLLRWNHFFWRRLDQTQTQAKTTKL